MNEREERKIKKKKYEWFERETLKKVNNIVQFNGKIEEWIWGHFRKLRKCFLTLSFLLIVICDYYISQI